MPTRTDQGGRFGFSGRAGVSAALMLGMLVVAVMAPSMGAAHADFAPAQPSDVRQFGSPIASPAPAVASPIASPAPDNNRGAMSPAPTNPSAAWRIADTDGVPARVHSAPSLDAAVVMRLDSGTLVEPLSETASADGYQWRRISVSGTTGWIVTTLLMEPTPPSRTPVYTVAAVGERGLNVRATPSTSAPIVGSLQEGQVVEVVGEPRDGDDRRWLQIKTDAVTGWVIAEAIGEGSGPG